MINRVEMHNWRAYEGFAVEFAPGITFLIGANGAGKTSILEAIAYALTGEPSTVKRRDKMLRDARQIATVRLEFTAAGRRYRVERSQSQSRAEQAVLFCMDDDKRLSNLP